MSTRFVGKIHVTPIASLLSFFFQKSKSHYMVTSNNERTLLLQWNLIAYRFFFFNFNFSIWNGQLIFMLKTITFLVSLTGRIAEGEAWFWLSIQLQGRNWFEFSSYKVRNIKISNSGYDFEGGKKNNFSLAKLKSPPPLCLFFIPHFTDTFLMGLINIFWQRWGRNGRGIDC